MRALFSAFLLMLVAMPLAILSTPFIVIMPRVSVSLLKASTQVAWFAVYFAEGRTKANDFVQELGVDRYRN